MKFCFDVPGRPNLASGTGDYDNTWPRTIPFRPLTYFDWLGIDYQLETASCTTRHAWYPIAIGWFDHSVDYISLISKNILQAVRANHIKLLFYYHEGDDPAPIKNRIVDLLQKHDLDQRCYVFFSANTAANSFENFHYFADHELFFANLNHAQKPTKASVSRSHRFLCLSRTHKLWRSSVVSDLVKDGLLQDSLWSYQLVQMDDQDTNCIEIGLDQEWQTYHDWFLSRAPYHCDTADTVRQNDHRTVNESLYNSAYCNIILETNFDNGPSKGVFLTEKTFKAIKYAQPFVLVGAAGSLQALRNLGYRVFDNVIDNSYDTIIDNTQRWKVIKRNIELINCCQNMESWYQKCLPDILHNQDLFYQRASLAVNRLVEKLQWHP
jgi:hypothetical protein